jgi:hypothetical protein
MIKFFYETYNFINNENTKLLVNNKNYKKVFLFCKLRQ